MIAGLFVMIILVIGITAYTNNTIFWKKIWIWTFRRTMHQSAKGLMCTENCHGTMIQEYNDSELHNQIKYLETLFDLPRFVSKNKTMNKSLDIRYVTDNFYWNVLFTKYIYIE